MPIPHNAPIVATKRGIRMDNLPLFHTKWSDRLAFDIALMLEGSGETVDEVKQRHKVSGQDISGYKNDPVFMKRVSAYRDDIKEKGLTFKLKARAQAEELLTTSWTLIHNPDVSAAVKADLIKSTVKWAGLETKADDGDAGAAGGVKITINLGGQDKTMTVDHEVEDVEVSNVG